MGLPHGCCGAPPIFRPDRSKRMTDKKDDIVLSIRGMSKSFGRNRVLDHINLNVKRGTVMD